MSRRGMWQMLFGIAAVLFFAVPAAMNTLAVVGYLEATPAVRAVSVLGAMASFVAVALATICAMDGYRTWRDWNHW